MKLRIRKATQEDHAWLKVNWETLYHRMHSLGFRIELGADVILTAQDYGEIEYFDQPWVGQPRCDIPQIHLDIAAIRNGSSASVKYEKYGHITSKVETALVRKLEKVLGDKSISNFVDKLDIIYEVLRMITKTIMDVKKQDEEDEA